MVWKLVLGFVVLVAASYVGTTMALGVFSAESGTFRISKGEPTSSRAPTKRAGPTSRAGPKNRTGSTRRTGKTETRGTVVDGPWTPAATAGGRSMTTAPRPAGRRATGCSSRRLVAVPPTRHRSARPSARRSLETPSTPVVRRATDAPARRFSALCPHNRILLKELIIYLKLTAGGAPIHPEAPSDPFHLFGWTERAARSRSRERTQ